MLARWKLALVAALLALLVANLAGRADWADHATPTGPPATLAPQPGPYDYVPVPAGPPTDQP
ncbi:MAG TPA: hypothetical protein VGM21_05595 [Actinomycetota bacterium]|jgi:hypothetical protein